MNLRHARHNDPEINLTSLIDVVFLLLIFFMVSTTFNRESAISIELPEADGKPLKTERFVVEISIDGQGRYFVNQRRIKNDKVSTLMRAIRLTRGDHENPQLIISSDRNAPYQAVVSAMDAARQLGIMNLTFATKQTDQ